MQTRQIKRFVAGQWNDIKWSEIKEGDNLRIYERGFRFHDGNTDTFVAAKNSFKNETGVWTFAYDRGLLNDIASYDVHENKHHGHPRRWRNLKKRPKGSKKAK